MNRFYAMKLQKHLVAAAILCGCLTHNLSAQTAGSSLAVKNGDKIAFLGDSITANGAKKGGYVTLVMDALKKEGLDVSHIPAGKSGNKSNDMLARLDAAVISKNPQWMLLSCGVNDVWHFKLRLGERTFEGVPLEDYKQNITAIIDKAQAAGIKVMILTATMIGEDPESLPHTYARLINEAIAGDARLRGTVVQTVGIKGHDGLAIAVVLGSDRQA